MKNPVLKDHFLSPRNMGALEHPTHHAIARSDSCSDIVKLTMNVGPDDIVQEIKAQVYGCGYSIAGASYFTERVKGKALGEIAKLTPEELRSEMGEVPAGNEGCITLPLKAFRALFNKSRGGSCVPA